MRTTEMYSQSPTQPFAASETGKFRTETPGDLEASLLRLLHDHHYSSFRLRDQADRAKNEAIKNAGRVADLLVDAVNGGVQKSFINEKRTELEIRALAVTVTRFIKQTNQWLVASHSVNTAVKEIGDFENWLKTIEFDCRSINVAIRNIHQE